MGDSAKKVRGRAVRPSAPPIESPKKRGKTSVDDSPPAKAKKVESPKSPVKPVAKATNGDVAAKRGRGRPPNRNKSRVAKPAPGMGRGRGRPKKNEPVAAKKSKKSENEASGEEEENAESVNGESSS